MNLLQRRVLRLEAAAGRRGFAHMSDGELDTLIRAELAAWLRDAPDACPAEVRADVLAFIDAGPGA